MKFITELKTTTFESSSGLTEQWADFYKLARKEIKAMLKNHTIDFTMYRGHFFFSGFLKTKNNKIFYFSLSDVRWGDGQMLIRTAKDFKDYSGGSNYFINMDNNFEKNFLKFINCL